MLADLTIHRWTATKHDRAISSEIEKTHSAKDAGRYNKQLIDKAHLAAVDELSGALRKYHYTHTLPWTDKGARLLPSKLFMEYRQGINELKLQRQAAVDKFLTVYPQLVNDARLRLNTMFQPEDYPPVDALRKSFGVELEIMPVPTSSDFRVEVSQEAQDEIRQQITESLNERQAKALKDCWARVREVVGRISDQCGNPKGRIHDSLVTNAADLVNVLDGLNISNDPALEAAGKELREMLVSADKLRNSPTTRAAVANKAAVLLQGVPV
jgi:hypothetical protein